MKKNLAIQIKAAILLMAFSTNTIIGFACSVGVNMSFNGTHHSGEETTGTTIHIHKGRGKHLHHQENTKPYNNSKKDDCCNDDVIGFQVLDKDIAVNPNTTLTTPVFTAIQMGSLDIAVLHFTQLLPHKHILPFFHPPPSDIGLLIQVFRI